MPPELRYLVAVDMDGTLLRPDHTIAPEDAAAIREAGARGVAVTIATGRLTSGALPAARELGLRTPLVLADGGLLLDPVTGEAIERHAIPVDRAGAAVAAMRAHDLAPFVFLADTIHCEATGEPHRPYVRVWSKDIVVHASLEATEAWRAPEGVALTVGIGSREDVMRASDHLGLAHADALDTVYFGMNALTTWAVRSLPRGCDKGAMLGRLAARLGLPRTRVAAVGDWFNDVGMFGFAGRSFAMGQAPDVVKRAATDVLTATSATGGGVAEALAAVLRGLDAAPTAA